MQQYSLLCQPLLMRSRYLIERRLPQTEQIDSLEGYCFPHSLQNFVHFLIPLVLFPDNFRKGIDNDCARLQTLLSLDIIVPCVSEANAKTEISEVEIVESPIVLTIELTKWTVSCFGRAMNSLCVSKRKSIGK